MKEESEHLDESNVDHSASRVRIVPEGEWEGHMDPTTEISIETVKERSVRGIVVLTGRTFFLQVLGLVAVGFLGAFLGPFEWGVFAILNAVINFLNYFSDVGLAAALIQKKEHPTETDLKTTFFVQEGLVVVIVGIVLILTPFFTHKYSLNHDGVILLYALTFSFVLSSLKSIPSILLERKLEFIKLTFPQILKQVVYYIVLVVFAVKGYGIKSFTIAVITRDIIGVVAIYIMQPWRPGFAFSKDTLKGLFKFGIPYQINTFLAAFKDDGMTLILGSILGPIGIGYLAFAQKFARYPLTFFMDTVTRVTFPAFSRMQDAKDHLPELGAHLILLDVGLPNLDGVSLYKILRGHSNTRNTPIIVITGSHDWELQRMGLQAGLLLRKPFRVQELLFMIQAILGDESPV